MSAKTARQGPTGRAVTDAGRDEAARPHRSPQKQTVAAGRTARSQLADVARASAEQVKANPFAAVAGVAAVSAGLALLLPLSRRETEMMGDVAGKLGDVAREAADTALDVGRNQVGNLANAALAGVGGAVVQAMVSDGPAETKEAR